mgnify:CR=1 FL=1
MANVEEIFEAALALDGDERRSFLEQGCPTPELRKQLEELLAAHDQAAGFLEEPPVPLASKETIGKCLDTKKDRDPSPIASLLNCLERGDTPDFLGELSDYEIEGVIGRGGMGIVLKARDKKLRRTVAIKVLFPSMVAEAAHHRRLLKEAQSAAQISHPNIVTVHSIEEAATPFIVMEYVHGEDIQQRLKRCGRLPASDVVAIARQIADGLAAAHRHGVIHGDIKPSNVLIDPARKAKIVDFGLAQELSTHVPRDGQVAGTPQFMAPEQTRGTQVDQRADFFSLGCVMYAMCTGRAPFEGDSVTEVLRRVREASPARINQHQELVPESLEALINRLMSKDPADRPTTAEEICKRLDAIGSDVAVPSQQRNTATPPRRRVLQTLFGAAAALLLVIFISEAAGWTQLRAMLQDVLRVKTPTGTLVIVVDDPGISVTVDGERVSIVDSKKNEFQFETGNHIVEASKEGKVIKSKIVSLSRDGKEYFSITKEPLAAADDGSPVVNNKPADSGRPYVPITDEPIRLEGHTHFVLSVCYSPDGSKLASIQFGGGIRVWNLADRSVVFEASTREQNPSPVGFSADGRLVCGVHQWNAETWEKLEDLKEPVIAWSGDGQLYATKRGQSAISIYETEGDQFVSTFETNHTKIYSVQFSPNNELLATAGNRNAKLWDVASQERIGAFHVCDDGVAAVAFSPDGSMVASAGRDKVTRVWDAALSANANSPRLTLAGHDDHLTGTVFLPGNKHLVTVSRETAITFPAPGKRVGNTIKIWDLASGTEIWNQSSHRHNVTGIALRHDGGQFATCSYDKTIRLWNVNPPPQVPMPK